MFAELSNDRSAIKCWLYLWYLSIQFFLSLTGLQKMLLVELLEEQSMLAFAFNSHLILEFSLYGGCTKFSYGHTHI